MPGLSEGNFKLFSVWFLTDHGFLLSSVINCYFDCKCALNCNYRYLPSSLRGERRELLKELSRGQLRAYGPLVSKQVFVPGSNCLLRGISRLPFKGASLPLRFSRVQAFSTLNLNQPTA